MTAGVPQGSIYGPLLFNIFTSDFPKDAEDWRTKIALYAVDAAIFTRSKNAELAAKMAQDKLEGVQAWYNKWRIRVNAEKTQAVIFHKPYISKPRCPILRIRQQGIRYSDKATYLGVTLDSKLTFHEHIKNITTKALGAKAGLAPILNNNSTPPEIRVYIYNTYIRPKLTYAIPSWIGLTNKSNREKINITERKCLRSILKIRWWHDDNNNEALYKKAGIKKMADIIREQSTRYFEKLAMNEDLIIKDLSIPKSNSWDRYKRTESCLKI
jgi:hypothetical protein